MIWCINTWFWLIDIYFWLINSGWAWKTKWLSGRTQRYPEIKRVVTSTAAKQQWKPHSHSIHKWKVEFRFGNDALASTQRCRQSLRSTQWFGGSTSMIWWINTMVWWINTMIWWINTMIWWININDFEIKTMIWWINTWFWLIDMYFWLINSGWAWKTRWLSGRTQRYPEIKRVVSPTAARQQETHHSHSIEKSKVEFRFGNERLLHTTTPLINTMVWWINTSAFVDQHNGLVDQHNGLVDQHPVLLDWRQVFWAGHTGLVKEHNVIPDDTCAFEHERKKIIQIAHRRRTFNIDTDRHTFIHTCTTQHHITYHKQQHKT